MNVGLFFDHYVNFLSVITDMQKKRAHSLIKSESLNPNTCYMTCNVVE